MGKRYFNKSGSKGFSLIELIVVIAIMVVLIGILSPTLIGQIEKANRSKDMTNAKNLESVLLTACSIGQIEIPEVEHQYGYGAWIMLCNKTQEYAPEPYHKYTINGMWCGANDGVIVNGEKAHGDWEYNKQIESILLDNGIDIYSLRTYSSGNKNGGDWIIIEVGYDDNMNLYSRIYSGYKNQNGALNKTDISNIERAMYKKE